MARCVLWLIIACQLFAACNEHNKGTKQQKQVAASAVQSAPTQHPMENGLYKVLRRGATEQDVMPLKTGEISLPYTRRFAPPDANAESEVLVLTKKPGAALMLARAPQGDPGRACNEPLQIDLTPAASAAMARFTSANVGSTVAIVIGGEVVTAHKIRQPITDGRFQITCCSEGACGFLMKQLTTIK